jgi:hypothetical protein
MSITSGRSTVTSTSPSTEAAKAPPRSHRPRRALLGWVAVAGACVAATALAIATLSGDGDSDTPPATVVPAHSQLVDHGSPRAIEGTVESPQVRPLPPTAEATGSNVEDMAPVADRGTFPSSVPAADGDPDEAPPVVSRSEPPR